MKKISIGDIFLNRYKIITEISSGHIATLYKVLDIGTNDFYVLKKFNRGDIKIQIYYRGGIFYSWYSVIYKDYTIKNIWYNLKVYLIYKNVLYKMYSNFDEVLMNQ